MGIGFCLMVLEDGCDLTQWRKRSIFKLIKNFDENKD